MQPTRFLFLQKFPAYSRTFPVSRTKHVISKGTLTRLKANP
jgi:hypothetical protein